MLKNSVLGCILSTLFVAGVATAGPPVTVIFKNLGTEDAEYIVNTDNEWSSYYNATPKPMPVVKPGEMIRFEINNRHPAPATTATITYKVASKICNFGSVYTNYNGTSPIWSKTANPKNGAQCTASITSTNPGSHTWIVEFTMR